VAAGGGAGTGKTIVAMEDAVRLARKELKTALICHSEPLAAHLRERLAKAEPRVQVWSFMGLCVELTQQASVPFSPASGIEKGIEGALRAVRIKPELRFDAVIVDEAQDFRTHWWIAIEEMLTSEQTSWLHAYFDTNQSIYGDLAKELASFRIVPVHLTRNLRNTRCIHEAASRFYKGIPITADGPEGMKVEWVECRGGQIAARATDAALRLMREKVSPEDIVILAVEDRMLSEIRNRAGFPDGVTVSLIRDFKGLERKAIILAATRDLADEAELAYVSLSRPRTHLVVTGENHMLSWLNSLS
jgi:superfamily I DNA/RNA helicase